jgi:hypothetical protein
MIIHVILLDSLRSVCRHDIPRHPLNSPFSYEHFQSRAPVALSLAPSMDPAVPRIKDNKTSRVADEDPPKEYRG